MPDDDRPISPGMEAGVFDRQTFGSGGVVERLIGRDQRDRRKARPAVVALDVQRRRELDGIVGAQRVRACGPGARRRPPGRG
jgi:hypothetical protein